MKNVVNKKCARGYEIEVLRSGAGYYLGTVDEIGCPNCRITNYFADRDELLNSAFVERKCPENDFCNKSCGCLK